MPLLEVALVRLDFINKAAHRGACAHVEVVLLLDVFDDLLDSILENRTSLHNPPRGFLLDNKFRFHLLNSSLQLCVLIFESRDLVGPRQHILVPFLIGVILTHDGDDFSGRISVMSFFSDGVSILSLLHG